SLGGPGPRAESMDDRVSEHRLGRFNDPPERCRPRRWGNAWAESDCRRRQGASCRCRLGDVERTGGAREQEPPQFGPVPRVGLREDALQMRPAAAPATATSLTLPPPGTRTATSASASVRLYSPVPPDRKPTSRLPPGTPLPARHIWRQTVGVSGAPPTP